MGQAGVASLTHVVGEGLQRLPLGADQFLGIAQPGELAGRAGQCLRVESALGEQTLLAGRAQLRRAC